MTLHEAIIKVLNDSTKSSLTTSEIAEILNIKKYYAKKDKSIITAYQIHGRTNKYKDIFRRNGNNVSLISQSYNSNKKQIEKSGLIKILESDSGTKDLSLLEKILINEKNFKTCEKSENLIPEKPGIYCIRINNSKELPEVFAKELDLRKHNIIYFGIASKSLNKRFFNQELRAKGHGTFFRSIGAVLNFRPEKGSLLEKKNKRNYKFSSNDEKEIINWINKNLLINWIEISNDLEEFETNLILKYKPLFNISKNPHSMLELSALRAECVRIANG